MINDSILLFYLYDYVYIDDQWNIALTPPNVRLKNKYGYIITIDYVEKKENYIYIDFTIVTWESISSISTSLSKYGNLIIRYSEYKRYERLLKIEKIYYGE